MASSPQFRKRSAAVAVDPKLIDGGPQHEMARYRALVSRTVEAFGDEIKASRWLSMPNQDLSGQTPLQAVQTSGYDMQVLEPLFDSHRTWCRLLTPEDLELDPGYLLAHRPLTLYRLAKARYANLSGIGAALAPGRWNRWGEEAIYTSTEAGVPVLERLVHTPKDLIPSNLALMKLHVSGDFAVHDGGALVWDSTSALLFCGSVAKGRQYLENSRPITRRTMGPFAVAFPSVIVPVWNVVLYPHGIGFWEHVTLESVEPFELDPRLFPDGIAKEDSERDIAS